MTIHEFIAGILKIPAGRIDANTSMKTVPEWDSLKHMELIVALEQHYAVALTGDEIAEMTSLPAINAILARHGLCT